MVTNADGKVVFKYSYLDENGNTVSFDATVWAAVGEIPERGGLCLSAAIAWIALGLCRRP